MATATRGARLGVPYALDFGRRRRAAAEVPRVLYALPLTDDAAQAPICAPRSSGRGLVCSISLPWIPLASKGNHGAIASVRGICGSEIMESLRLNPYPAIPSFLDHVDFDFGGIAMDEPSACPRPRRRHPFCLPDLLPACCCRRDVQTAAPRVFQLRPGAPAARDHPNTCCPRTQMTLHIIFGIWIQSNTVDVKTNKQTNKQGGESHWWMLLIGWHEELHLLHLYSIPGRHGVAGEDAAVLLLGPGQDRQARLQVWLQYSGPWVCQEVDSSPWVCQEFQWQQQWCPSMRWPSRRKRCRRMSTSIGF